MKNIADIYIYIYKYDLCAQMHACTIGTENTVLDEKKNDKKQQLSCVSYCCCCRCHHRIDV